MPSGVDGRKWLLVVALAALGCGQHDRAPVALDAPQKPAGGSSSGGKGNTRPSGGGLGQAGTGGTTQGEAGASTDGGLPSTSDGGEPSNWAFPFDPTEVYLFGTLREGTVKVAITTYGDPNQYSVGFGTTEVESEFGLRDGQLVYTSNGEPMRIFAPDYVGGASVDQLNYPERPQANDPIVDTAPCEVTPSSVTIFHTSPDGRLIYRCEDEGPWYEDGKVVYAGDDLNNVQILALGPDGLALVYTGNHGPGVMSLADGEPHWPAAGAGFYNDILAIRSRAGAFHFIGATFGGPRELYELSADGLQHLGTYAALGPNVRNESKPVLAADDALFQLARVVVPANTGHDDVIIRRTIDGESDIVYAETDNPTVQVHGSFLFTGP